MSQREKQRKYEEWWLGYRVRRPFSRGQFKRVTDIRFISSPSGIAGVCEVCFEDGTDIVVGGGVIKGSGFRYIQNYAFRPRKHDLELHPDDEEDRKIAERLRREGKRFIAEQQQSTRGGDSA